VQNAHGKPVTLCRRDGGPAALHRVQLLGMGLIGASSMEPGVRAVDQGS